MDTEMKPASKFPRWLRLVMGGAACAAKVAEVMGVEAGDLSAEGRKAFVMCRGDNDTAVLNEKGRKVCTYGCIACGLCAKACPMGILSVEEK